MANFYYQKINKLNNTKQKIAFIHQTGRKHPPIHLFPNCREAAPSMNFLSRES